MRMEDPLSGWPPTAPLHKGPGYRVRARFFTPGGAEAANMLAAALILLASMFMVMAWLSGAFENPLWTGGIYIVGAVLFWIYRYGLARPLFGKTVRIEINPDMIRIGGRIGYKNYDRRLPHEFEYEIHERAQIEAENAAMDQQHAAMRKKKAGAYPRFHRESWHIILRYAGQRIDVASVFGKKKAEALLTRLHLLDAMMDAATGEVTSQARPAPATQYGQRPETG